MTTNTNAALREKLIDLIAEHLSGTYHCTRVWEAWNASSPAAKQSGAMNG